jgi:hypothetical protein
VTGRVVQQQQPIHSSTRMLIDSFDGIVLSCQVCKIESDLEGFIFLYDLIIYEV